MKHDLAAVVYGAAARGAAPLWLADMDLPCCPSIRAAVRERAALPTFGYTYQPQEIWARVQASASGPWLCEGHARRKALLWDVMRKAAKAREAASLANVVEDSGTS